ncbi:hypothetical protein HYDPIDRAFT_33293 [Hydnomerulius pinastri MD-312]|uniref:Uncharacterized protein n=1 Tax=Hydnomerulius pinastri MD-312 TaxID=994086 RepID=A0A0C9W0G5_9AGAM|nr:hypothetical protein HYDPIDRAFT_33293 [Hydnomerulius pinastri MD-312]
MTFGLIPTPVPEQLNKEITARQAAEERAQARQDSRREQPVTLIERLKGQAGEKDFSLIEAMELENDTGAYLEILVRSIVRDLCLTAQLNCNLDYCHQPPRDLGNIFEVAKQQNPYLERFRNNWATSEIVKQFLRNRRKYARTTHTGINPKLQPPFKVWRRSCGFT